MLGPDPGPERAPTGSERRVLIAFGVLFGALLLGDLFREIEPVKASPIFFCIAWVGLTAIHEAAHALMARWVGWRVNHIVIGFGRTWKQWQWGNTPVELRVVPLGGFVVPEAPDDRPARLASAAIYLAGPGSELLLAGLVVAVVGQEALNTPTLPMIALKSLVWAGIIGAVINLIPIQTGNGTVTDGLGIVLSLIQPDESFRTRKLAPLIREAQALLRADKLDEARALLEGALDDHPDALAVWDLLAWIRLHQGRGGEVLMELSAIARRLEGRQRQGFEALMERVRQAMTADPQG